MLNRQQIDPKILAEAVDWFIKISDEPLDQAQQIQFENWKNQSPAHVLAWQKTEKLQQRLQCIPNQISKKTLKHSQRSVPIGKLALLFACSTLLGSIAYFNQKNAWLADYRTTYGEQRHIILEDGTNIILNSKTAFDVNYSAEARQIVLHYGEIMVETGKESAQHYRPFTVLGKHGSIQALGTKFDVQQQAQNTKVAVLEHAVKITTADSGQQYTIVAGQQTDFNSINISKHNQLQYENLMWHKGLIIANRITLQDFANRLHQYYGVNIEVNDHIANMLISGTYPSNDLDRLLATLQETYQIRSDSNFFGTKITLSQNSNH